MAENRIGDPVMLTGVDLATDGTGIARHDGFTFFIRGLLPGEEGQAVITGLKKTYGFARLSSRTRTSPDRLKPACPAFGRCGGCELLQLSYPAQLAFKEKRVRETLMRLGHLTELPYEGITGFPQHRGYRNKVQIPYALVNGVLTCGYYQGKSHVIVPLPACLLQSEEMTRLALIVQAKAGAWGIASTLRHLVIRASRDGKMMAILVLTRPLKDERILVKDLTHAVPSLSGLFTALSPEEGNRVMATTPRRLWGTDRLTERINGLDFRYGPESFFQVNPQGCEALYERIKAFAALTGKEDVLDLYCGVGSIGLSLSHEARSLSGIEIVPEAVSCAQENARENNITNALFEEGDVARALPGWHDRHFDLVIVDPPRKGLEEATLAALLALGPRAILYSSCDVATQARDIARLSEAYHVTRVASIDMFPDTCEIENLVRLDRKDSA